LFRGPGEFKKKERSEMVRFQAILGILFRKV